MDGLSGRLQRKRDLCHSCRHTGSLQLYTRSKGSFGNIPRRWAADRCCIHRKMLKSSIWCQETFSLDGEMDLTAVQSFAEGAMVAFIWRQSRGQEAF